MIPMAIEIDRETGRIIGTEEGRAEEEAFRRIIAALTGIKESPDAGTSEESA